MVRAMIKHKRTNMNFLKYQRVLVCLALMLSFVSGCSADRVPDPAPYITPDFAPDDDPTAGAMVRSTRQAQATVTRQAQLNEEAMQAAVQSTQVAVQATQTAEDHANA